MSPETTEQTPGEKMGIAVVTAINAFAAETVYNNIQARTSRALAALSSVKEITTDEQDAAAEGLLVKVRKTFELVQTERKTVTDRLNTAITLFINAENPISPTKEGNEYQRVKKLRDAWATKKAQFIASRKSDLQREADIATEKARIAAEFDKVVLQNLQGAVILYQNVLNGLLVSLTIDKYEQVKTDISRTPSLKEAKTADWFKVSYNTLLIKPEEYEAIKAEAKQRFPIIRINTDFVNAITPLQTKALDDLKNKFHELQQIENVKLLNKQEAERLEAERIEKERQTVDKQNDALKQQLAAEATQQDAEIAGKMDAAQMDAAFLQQSAEQEIPDLNDVVKRKIAILTAPDEDVPVVLSELIYKCILHKDFSLYAKDRSGKTKLDENGDPVYAEWLDPLLRFYAAKVPGDIPGIERKEVISTKQMSKK